MSQAIATRPAFNESQGGTALGQLAELLVACWVVSGQDARIPSSHGLLDRAIYAALKQGAFPEWLHESLHFVDSRVGLQCVEVPAILDWAQRAQLTTAPNPSYQYTQVQVSSWLAQRLLRTQNVSRENAEQWGQVLRSSMEAAIASMRDYETPDILEDQEDE